MEQLDMLCDKMEIDSVGTDEGYSNIYDYNMELVEYYKSDSIFKILPTEIVLKIFSFLDEDTITVGRVCKFWNGLAFRETYERGMAEMEIYQDNFKAITEFTRSIRINPSLPSPWFKRGVAHYKECEEREAVRNIAKALTLSPTPVEYHLMKAMLHQIQLQFDFAVQEATKAIELEPENGAAYYLRGYNRFDLQDYEGSIIDLTNCLQLPYPYKSKVLNCRGWCYNIRGDLDRALEDFTASGRLNIRYTKPFVNKAIVLSSRKDKPVIMQEEVFLTEYLSQSSDRPNLGAIYYTRAAIRQQWENYNNAISDYLEAIKEGYHSPHKAYVSIGWCYEKLNDFNKAIEFYNNAIQLKPSYSIAIEHRAGAKARTNNKTVDEDCKLAIKTNPKNLSFSFRYLAAVQADNNDYSLAIKTLTDGIKANPLDIDMLLNRAGYYTCQVDLVRAIKDYDTCLKHRPDTFDAWKYRANAKFAAGDLQGAAHDYAEAMRIHRNPDVTVWNNYAMTLLCEGEFEKACDFLSKAIAWPDSSTFTIQLNQNLQLVQYVQEKRYLPKTFAPNFLVDPYFEMSLSKKMKDCGKSKLCSVLKVSEGHGISHLKQRVLGWKKRARVHL